MRQCNKKTKDLIMSFCITCANLDKNTGKCSYSGNCIIKQYKIDPNYLPNFLSSAKEIIDEEIKNAKAASDKKTVSGDEVVFNPFQRGNGCTLAGYTAKEILSHTR